MKKALSLVLSLSFVFCSVFASGDIYVASAKIDTDAAQDKIDKINDRISEAQKAINGLKQEEKETEKYASLLRKEIGYKQDKIDTLANKSKSLKQDISNVESKIVSTKKEIDAIQAQIDAKQKDFEKTYDLYSQRLRAMYVSGHVSNLEVLLSSTDISSILIRSQMISSVSKQDSQMLDELTAQMESIEKDKVGLEKKRNELNADKQRLENNKAELDKDLNEIKAEKAQLDSKVSECNAIMRKITNDKSEYLEGIEADKAEIARIEKQIQDEIKDHGSSGGGYLPGGGRLGYPTSHRNISAGYPNYSDGRYHGGVDFPCPVGTPVYASADGVVISVKRLTTSYGYHFIIDHGDGLSTLYAHNSEIMVSVGQHVTKGQMVAKSGKTGNVTGPHVHFEVRVNGKRVNPMGYLG